MALQDQVNLDITAAQRQIAALEAQLSQLSQPVSIPVQVQGGGQLDAVRNDLAQSEDAVEALNRELAQTDDRLSEAASDARRAGDQIEQAGRRGRSAFAGLNLSLGGIVGGLGLAVAGREFFQFASGAITAASDLEQSVGALEAVFGDLGDQVAAFGEVADEAVGLSASQFNQLASLLGSQLQTFGFNAQDAARETQNLIGLSADLAATFGGPVSDAVEAVSSLLRGEVNPIERYGVAMNETLVQAKALELGLADTTAELTLQDKTLARLKILWEQTANAQGQFNREADTTAGRLERIKADFANFTAEFGEQLIPAFESLLDAAPALVGAIEGLIPVIVDLADAIADIDWPSAIDGVRQFGNTASGVLGFLLGDLEAATGAKFVNDFNAAVDRGIPSADAFLAVLKQFSGFRFDVAQSLNPEQVALVVQSLQAAADLDLTELDNVRDIIRQFGLAEGLSEAEVEGIVRGITEIRQEILGVGTATDSSGPKVRRIPRDFEAVGDAAEEAIPGLDGLEEALAQFDADTIETQINAIEAQFNRLPTGLDAAAEALRDDEGEIVSDFSKFLRDLDDEISARAQFRENIDLLERMGLDQLAEVFRQEGLDAAAALADAVANPEEAARAEALLDEDARRLADSFRATFAEQMTAGIDITIPVNATAAVQSLITTGIDPSQALAEIVAQGGRPSGPITDLNQGTGTNVTQNFFTEPRPTVNTERARQAVATIN